MVARAMKADAGRSADESVTSFKRMHPAVEATLIESRGEFLRYLARRLGDVDTAEDVLQQFYFRVVSTRSELQKAESVVSWLYTVLRWTLVDHYRREAARRRREDDYAVVQALAEERWDAEPAETDCTCLHKVLPTLRPDYSDILHRVDLCGSLPRRVASDLGIAGNNVRVRLHRARRALRQALLQRCGKCAEHGCRECDCDDAMPSASLTEKSWSIASGGAAQPQAVRP